MMSWNDILSINNHFTVGITTFGYGLLITALTMELVTACLLLTRRSLEKLGAYRLMECLGRIVTVLYYSPAALWLVRLRHLGMAAGYTSGELKMRGDEAFSAIKGFWLVILVFLGAWLAGVVWHLVVMLKKRNREMTVIRAAIPGQLEWYPVLERMKQVTGVCRSVKLKQTYGITSALTCGILSAKVVVPVRKYREEELEVIFAHELMHIKRKDVLIRLILSVTECVFWFCPLIRKLGKFMTKWSETCCDIMAGDIIGGAREYFDILSDLLPVSDPDAPHAVCNAGGERIDDRIMRMKAYQKGLKRESRRLLLGALILVMALAGSITAMAAGEGVAALSSTAYQLLEISDVSGTTDPRVNDGIEYTEVVEEDPDRVIIANPIVSFYGTFEPLGWEVPADHIVQTPYFTATDGGYIRIALEMDPEDVTVYVGIYEPGSVKRYVIVSGEVDHKFQLTKNGLYKVFVENPSQTTDITVCGGYFYE